MMPSWPRLVPGRPTRRAIALAAAAALLVACGADQGVITLSAADTRDVPPVGDEVAPSSSNDAVVPDTLPATESDAEPDVATTTDAPSPTLPPIIEPQLSVSIPIGDVVDVDPNKPERDHDEFVAVAFTDIERWWADVYPEVYGEPFQPLLDPLCAEVQ